jgi:predicted nucleotidyltransferase
MSQRIKPTGYQKPLSSDYNRSKSCVGLIMEIELPPDFKEFLKLLNARGVKYLLIGGYAVGYHGYPRTTNDIDIWIEINPYNAERMVKALQEFGFAMPDLSPNLFLQDQNVIRMGVPPMRIEVLTKISGVTFQEAYAERVIDTIDDVEVSLISLRQLKINKKASGRHKDLDDLEHLP